MERFYSVRESTANRPVRGIVTPDRRDHSAMGESAAPHAKDYRQVKTPVRKRNLRVCLPQWLYILHCSIDISFLGRFENGGCLWRVEALRRNGRAERAKTSPGRSHALDDTLEQQHGPKRMKRDITAQKRHELKKPIRVLLAVLIAMAGASVVLAVYIANIDSSNAAERDFISYWAAGQQLVHGQNPYDIEAVRALETGAGRNPSEHVLMMRNPPVAFFMALPFGYMRPKTGLITWLIVLIGVLLLASFLIWRLNTPRQPL